MNNIDHDLADNVVCPHCGKVHDVTDYEIDGIYHGTENCDDCGKPFRWVADFTITYVTTKIKEIE